MSDTKEKLTGHNYDGIEEYDNPLPSWWLITFILCVQFGFIYWIHYEFGRAPTQLEELRQDLAQIKSRQSEQPAVVDKDDDLTALIKDQAILSNGKGVYVARCAACHGAELQGSVGPNLVDDYWIHGNRPSEIAAIVRAGVLDKGMPPWKEMLSNDEIRSVVAYVAANLGTHPANPKAPQGNKVGQKQSP